MGDGVLLFVSSLPFHAAGPAAPALWQGRRQGRGESTRRGRVVWPCGRAGAQEDARPPALHVGGLLPRLPRLLGRAVGVLWAGGRAARLLEGVEWGGVTGR